eukprot:CAMPEP_0197035638 /NCGR_PEP_ID=MMETSP1384-20130603/13374_1 /TAXON_ID=29189 /ORGANISM="Ammonia sp." /LENGTH=806 /DNA_ID=CAMNT_0042465723 /DNA_START=144 /DNA_END=2564 /DNA_ORIENTATION=-
MSTKSPGNKSKQKKRSKNKPKNARKRTHSSMTTQKAPSNPTINSYGHCNNPNPQSHHVHNLSNGTHPSLSSMSSTAASLSSNAGYTAPSTGKSSYFAPSSFSNIPRHRMSKNNKKKRGINRFGAASNDANGTCNVTSSSSSYKNKSSSSRSNRLRHLRSKQSSNYHHHHHHQHSLGNALSAGPSKERIQQYKKNLYSDDLNKQLHAVSQLRILLSDEQQPPIDAVIRANCVPRLIQILRTRDSINLLFETAWVLTNICSGSHEHTMAVVEANGIECILDLLDMDDIAVLEQSIWVLGNIAGDGTNARDICLNKGVLTRLIKLAKEQTKLKTFSTKVPPERRQIGGNEFNHSNNGHHHHAHAAGNNDDCKQPQITSNPSQSISVSSVADMPLSFQRNFVWTISNLVRGKPQPEWDRVACVIPIILLYLNCTDLEVLTDTCWALSYLSDGCNEHIQSILDLSARSEIDISSYLVRFLDKKSMNVLVPALRTCGNIVSGSDHQTQQIIDRGLLTKLKRLLRHPNHSVKKEAIWTVSNITAGNPTQIQSVIDHGLIEPLVDILTDYQADPDLVKECIWAISNATTGGTPVQLKYLSQYASLGLSRVMSHFPADRKLQMVLLEGLDNLLSFTNEHPIPLSESPLQSYFHRRDTFDDTLYCKKAHTMRSMDDDDDDNKENVSMNQSHQMDQDTTDISSTLPANELTEEYIKKRVSASTDHTEEYKDIDISVDKTDGDYNDIYDISSAEESDNDYLIDIDSSNNSQNYVAYIMEQAEAHRVLEDWYYDNNQDPDVAQLAKQIYIKYFNEPFQF